MRPEDLTSLLLQSRARGSARTRDCPDEHVLAGYVDGTLETDLRSQLETHLADCDPCLELVGELCRLRETAESDSMPDLVLARAHRLVERKAGHRRWTDIPPRWIAAAATVVLSIMAVVQYSQSPHREGMESSAFASERTTRANRTPTLAPLEILSPGVGATIDPTQLVVRWTRVPDARFYDVRIVSESGDVVSEERVIAGTQWRPPGEAQLSPGREYFVQVDAYLSEAKTASSTHVPFTVSD